MELKIRIGIGLGVHEMVTSGAELRGVCRAVEEEGFDSLWLSEVVTSHSLDPFAALGFVAALTQRVKMGTSVLVVPGRQPAVLAKALATLDVLSGGRVLPILGLGSLHAPEQQALAIQREDRGPWVEEVVPLLRRLWSEEAVAHRGSRFSFDGITLHPRPARPLPIWLGGRDDRELRRVGRLGDGWLASFATPEEVAVSIATIKAAAARHHRTIDDDHYGILFLYSLEEPSPQAKQFTAWRRPDLRLPQLLPVGASALRQRLAEYLDAGASKFILIPADRPPDWSWELARLADAVLSMQTRAHSDPVRAGAVT